MKIQRGYDWPKDIQQAISAKPLSLKANAKPLSIHPEFGSWVSEPVTTLDYHPCIWQALLIITSDVLEADHPCLLPLLTLKDDWLAPKMAPVATTQTQITGHNEKWTPDPALMIATETCLWPMGSLLGVDGQPHPSAQVHLVWPFHSSPKCGDAWSPSLKSKDQGLWLDGPNWATQTL